MNIWHIKQAVRTVRHGGIIAYPTEAVWGLGCDPWNRAAVTRLLALKNRSMDKGLILVASELSQLGDLLIDLSDSERLLISQNQPQPTTWLIPDTRNYIPRWIKGLHSEIAVRVSTHSGVRELCNYQGGMLVSTSANVSNQQPARSLREVRASFGRGVDYLLPGRLGSYQRPSEIRRLKTGVVTRTA